MSKDCKLACHLMGTIACLVKGFHREALVFIPATCPQVQLVYLALGNGWRGGNALGEAQPEHFFGRENAHQIAAGLRLWDGCSTHVSSKH